MTGNGPQETSVDRPTEPRREAEQAVLRILASADDVASAAPRILEAVCRCGDWDLGALWRVDARDAVLRLTDLWHREPLDLGELVAVARATPCAPGIGLPGRVWSSRGPAWVKDVVADASRPGAALAAQAGLHAAFGFPIRIRDEVIAVMTFHGPELREPDLDLLDRLYLLGGQIGHFFDRVRGQEALAASEARYRGLFAQLEQAVILMSGGRAVDYNPATLRLFGLSRPDELIGKTLLDLSPEHQPDGTLSSLAFARRVEAALAGEPQIFEWQHVRPDGSRIDVETRLSAIQPGDGPLLQCIVTDLTERKRTDRALRVALAQVRELTLQDPLTGVHNRRHLEQHLAVELVAARRRNEDLSVALFDLDHLKVVNDTHGHAAGDVLLKAVATALADAIRVEDVIARYGGEEFVIVMRHTNGRAAMEVAERLRHRVAELVVRVGGDDLGITVSGGVACFSELGDLTGDSLLGRADDRLYRAKTLGRNCVVGPG